MNKILTALFLMAAFTIQAASASKAPFGRLADGREVEIYTLVNKNGMEARIMTYGGTIVSLKVPDRDGKLGDVVLGYDNLDGYLKNSPYFGAIIGRYGNRIGKGQFSLNGRNYQLSRNNNGNHLHGGERGFDKVLWSASPYPDGSGLILSYISDDGEMGYPGILIAFVTYSLTSENELRIDYRAWAPSQDTIVNLTHHSYFNLAGEGTILDHELTIQAAKFTPVDKGLIPTGELKSVDGTPFDFRKATAIGSRINKKDRQLKYGLGYDHNWVLDRGPASMGQVASLYDPKSGRRMDILTVEPGLQFYSGNFLDGTIKGKSGQVYQHRSGLCLETQHFPDSPNHPDFPSTLLKAGQAYTTSTIYRFSVKK